MSLLDAVQLLVDQAGTDPQSQILGQALLSAAEVADSTSATPAGKLRASQALVELMAHWAETAALPELPRCGRESGERARLILLAVGMPAEQVDTADLSFGLDALELLRIKRERRLAGLPAQPAIDVAMADAIERGAGRLVRAASTREDFHTDDGDQLAEED